MFLKEKKTNKQTKKAQWHKTMPRTYFKISQCKLLSVKTAQTCFF